MDGADGAPLGDRRRLQPAGDLRAADARRLPSLLRWIRDQPLATAAQLVDGVAPVRPARPRAGLPSRVRALDPTCREVAGRDVLLPHHEDAADRRGAATAVPLR